MRLVHRIKNDLWRMAEPEHAVTATVIDHGALEADDPGTCRRNGNIGIDRVARVKIGQAILRLFDLLALIEQNEIRVGLLQVEKALVGPLDCDREVRMLAEKVADDVIRETPCNDRTGVIPHFLQARQEGIVIVKIRNLRHERHP